MNPSLVTGEARPCNSTRWMLGDDADWAYSNLEWLWSRNSARRPVHWPWPGLVGWFGLFSGVELANVLRYKGENCITACWEVLIYLILQMWIEITDLKTDWSGVDTVKDKWLFVGFFSCLILSSILWNMDEFSVKSIKPVIVSCSRSLRYAIL